MTLCIDFDVDGLPKGQPRPRAFARKIGDKFVARVHNPGTAEAWKGCIARDSAKWRPETPLTGPVVVGIDFRMPRPKSLMRKKDPPGEVECLTKPDIDNLIKSTLDAMTELGWWGDDAQIVKVQASKYYHAKEARPGAEIRVYFTTNLPNPTRV